MTERESKTRMNTREEIEGGHRHDQETGDERDREKQRASKTQNEDER